MFRQGHVVHVITMKGTSMRLLTITTICSVLLLSALGCATAPQTAEKRDSLSRDVNATIDRFKAEDPDINTFFNTSVGYAVFPSVGKGGLVAGGAYGRGELFERGKRVGFCDLTQGTLGLQLGGQAYSEIIFFQNEARLEEFKRNTFELAAQASAVALTYGASADASYENGVAVFTMEKGGLMYEASIGGQRFSFVPN